MRLLRVDGTVLVSPARVREASPAARQDGAGLAEAARLLRENAELLDRRANRSVR